MTGKGIAEPQPQPPCGFIRSISRNRRGPAITQHAQIIDPVDVIGVVVRPEHCVDPVNLPIEQLVAQIRRGID